MTPPAPSRKLRRRPRSDPSHGSAVQRPIGAKPSIPRRAVAEGWIRLLPRTMREIRQGRIEKGDPLAAGSLAGLAALKRTSELLPHCHLVPLTFSRVDLRLSQGGVRGICLAETLWSTGVEMEALVGVTVALLTVWDMVKYLEKDAGGQYPATRLEGVRVTQKTLQRPRGASP
jgi:cyclic pyranopterin phosphate synthase